MDFNDSFKRLKELEHEDCEDFDHMVEKEREAKRIREKLGIPSKKNPKVYRRKRTSK